MSTIRNANVATIAAQYSQEYRTPCRPSIAFLSTRLLMERLSLLRPVAVKRLLRRRGGLRVHEALGLADGRRRLGVDAPRYGPPPPEPAEEAGAGTPGCSLSARRHGRHAAQSAADL